MSYTIDNPKQVEYIYKPGVNDFTGVVKDENGTIAYYKNGKIHRENGPAVITFFNYKVWYYNGEVYGVKDDFTDESWINKWKLEIFK